MNKWCLCSWNVSAKTQDKHQGCYIEDSRSHGNEAEVERGLALGARLGDQGACPPTESNQDPLSGSISTDLKDQG